MAAIVQTVRGYVDELLSLNFRQLLSQGVNLGACIQSISPAPAACSVADTRHAGLIVTSALMIWKTLILVTGSESPVSTPGCAAPLA